MPRQIKAPKGSKASNNRVQKASANTNRTGLQAEFKGTKNTPVTGANEGRVLDLLGHHSTKNTQVGKQSNDLLDTLGNSRRGWKVTSGPHTGGLGGADGEADPRQHITLSTGKDSYHLRFNNKGRLMGITGKGIREGKGKSHAAAPAS